ncbi:MAG: indole-3-glycerol phosphate synthase TrpC [Microthrixaceae bacterium]
MATYLDAILQEHRTKAQEDTRNLEQLIEQARMLPRPRGFAAALRASVELAVIAEVKRRSPSKGVLSENLNPKLLAQNYELGGASCLSVLTDQDYFGGSTEDLEIAKEAVSLPVLRKDFTVSARDVCDAKLMGADCVLLIAAALDNSELRDFSELASELNLDALVEIHDEAELERAVSCTSAQLIGVNQRDLETFMVDQARAVRMAAIMPVDTIRVAESGVRGQSDALALAAAGYHAVLVGELLVRSADPAAAIAELRVALPERG